MPGTERSRPGYLLPQETVWVDVNRHWTILVGPAGKTVLAAALATFLALRTAGDGTLGTILALAALAAWGRLVWQVVDWRADRFIATDKRVLVVSGLLTRRVAMMPIGKVTDMTYERSWPGRVLGYGTFVFESAGQDQALHRIDHLPEPDENASRLFTLLFGSAPGPHAPRPAAMPSVRELAVEPTPPTGPPAPPQWRRPPPGGRGPGDDDGTGPEQPTVWWSIDADERGKPDGS